MACQCIQDRRIVPLLAHHVLFEDFQCEDASYSCDDLGAGLIRRMVCPDHGTFVGGIEGVLHAQRYSGLTEDLGGFRVYRLHAHVRKLVGNIVVGRSDLSHLICPDELRIGAGKMELLVNDCFIRAYLRGEALRTSPPCTLGQTGARGLQAHSHTRDDRKFGRDID